MRHLGGFALLGLLFVLGCNSATVTPTLTASPNTPTATPSPTPVVTFIPPTFSSNNDITSTPPSGNVYYISPNGSDSNSGLTEDQAWQTLEKVNQHLFQPGDVVRFERGGSWSGGLTVTSAGEAGKPVTFTSYGSGPLPVISNPGGDFNFTSAIWVRADWIVVEGLKVSDSQDAGVYVQANQVVVRNMEATNVGIGIKLNGSNNLVTHNFIHDLHMVRNTPGGADDYGAIGIAFNNASYNEISYNRIARCIAPSYDFGTDGGVLEFFGQTHGNFIHHNWGADSNGFIEVGGGAASENLLAYNVSVNNGGFTSLHLTDVWASAVSDFRVENNTIVEMGAAEWMVFKFAGDPSVQTFALRNNIIYVTGFQGVASRAGFTHANNLYYIEGSTKLGFELGAGEQMGNPLFVNLAQRDFRLQPQSPAIDAGLPLGYLLDFLGLPVPFGRLPDLGAFEFHPR